MYFKGSPLLVCALILGVLGKDRRSSAAPRRKLSRHAEAGTCKHQVGGESSRRCLQEIVASSPDENPFPEGPVINTFAGIGVGTYDAQDGKAPKQAAFKTPTAITEDPIGRVFYISDSGNIQVRGINTTSGKVFKLLDGKAGLLNVTVGGAYELLDVRSVDYALYYKEHIYLSDFASSRILRVHKSGSPIELIAGSSGLKGASGDCGAATLARFRYPRGLTIVPQTSDLPARLVITDSGNNRIRVMDITGWPGCVEPHYECSGPWIDRMTGITCDVCDNPDDCEDDIPNPSGTTPEQVPNPCFYVTETPDECAFTCGRWNKGLYGPSVPRKDISLGKSDAQRLFDLIDDDTGALTFPFTTTTDPPETLQAYSVLKGLINNTRLRSLTYPFLKNLIETKDWSTPMKLRFENIAVRYCTDWLWWRNESDPEAGTSGKCFLKAGAPPVMDDASGNVLSGTRVVRGYDWQWGNQDGGRGGKGTTRDGEFRTGWVKVEWDNGKVESYRTGAGGMEYQFFDLEQLPNPTCENGKLSPKEPGKGSICCPAACGECGRCDAKLGSSYQQNCCREYIEASMNMCNFASAPCIMTYTYKPLTGKTCIAFLKNLTDPTKPMQYPYLEPGKTLPAGTSAEMMAPFLLAAQEFCRKESLCGGVFQASSAPPTPYQLCDAEVDLVDSKNSDLLVLEKAINQQSPSKCDPRYLKGRANNYLAGVFEFVEGYPGGKASCSPGRVQTMIGGTQPGQDGWSVAETPLVAHRLKTPLKGPRAVVTNRDQALTVFVSDTGGHRIVGYPTNQYTVYRARFWILLTGPNATHMTRIVQDEAKGEGVSGSIAKTLKRILNPGNVYEPQLWVKETGGDGNNETMRVAFDICDPNDRASADYLSELGARVDDFNCALGGNLCKEPTIGKNIPNGTYLGFKTVQCCQTAVAQCAGRCGIYMYMLEAARSAQERCEAHAALDNCLDNSNFCSNLTAIGNMPGNTPGNTLGNCKEEFPDHAQNPVMDIVFKELIRKAIDEKNHLRLDKFCPFFNFSSVHSSCPRCDNEVYRMLVGSRELDKMGLHEDLLDVGGCGSCRGGCVTPNGICTNADEANCIDLIKGTMCKTNIYGRLLDEHEATMTEKTTTTTTTPVTIGLYYNIETRGKNTWLRIVRALERLKRDQYAKEKNVTVPEGENLFENFVKTMDLNFRALYGKGGTIFNVTVVSAYGEGNDAFKFFGTSFVQPPSAAYWEFGKGSDGYTKDDEDEIPAKTSEFNSPLGLAIDKADQLYVADSMNARVRRIKLEGGRVGTVAGEGLQYFQGDGGLGYEGSLNLPSDVVVDKDGAVFITDTNNHRIRKLEGLVFSPACPNLNVYLKEIGVKLGRSASMQKFHSQVLSRLLSWGGGGQYESYEYVTNRWIDTDPINITEWIEESQEVPPVENIKKRTIDRNALLFELAITSAYECGNCSRKENKIIKGCESATQWAVCSDKVTKDASHTSELRTRIMAYSGTVCGGGAKVNCDSPFCKYACDQCLNPQSYVIDEDDVVDENSSNYTYKPAQCDLTIPMLLQEVVMKQFNTALNFLDEKLERSRWRCPRIKWNNGTGTRQGVYVRDVLSEVMDVTRTPDHMLDEAISGMQNGICRSTCDPKYPVTSICEQANKQTLFPPDGDAKKYNDRMMAQKSQALDKLKNLRRESKPTTPPPDSNAEVSVEKTKYDDDPEDGVFSVKEVTQRTAADELKFKTQFAETVQIYTQPVPDELSYDSACRDLFFDWYADILANCTETGSKFYHRASQIPQLMFAQITAQNGEPLPSPCHPGCGFLHPDLGIGNQDCCGADGYRCEENEGNCDVDSDCVDGLICGTANCLWNAYTSVGPGSPPPDNCCTRPRWENNIMELRDLALQIGWDQVKVYAKDIEDLVAERREQDPLDAEKDFRLTCFSCGGPEDCSAGRRLQDVLVDRLVPRWTDRGVPYNSTHNFVKPAWFLNNTNRNQSARNFSNSRTRNHSNISTVSVTQGRNRVSRRQKRSRKPWDFFARSTGPQGFRRLVERAR